MVATCDGLEMLVLHGETLADDHMQLKDLMNADCASFTVWYVEVEV